MRLLSFDHTDEFHKRMSNWNTEKNYCYICGRAMKPGPYRAIHVVDGGGIILHPDEEEKYQSDAGEMGFWPVGNDCAKKLGLAWTHPNYGELQ